MLREQWSITFIARFVSLCVLWILTCPVRCVWHFHLTPSPPFTQIVILVWIFALLITISTSSTKFWRAIWNKTIKWANLVDIQLFWVAYASQLVYECWQGSRTWTLWEPIASGAQMYIDFSRRCERQCSNLYHFHVCHALKKPFVASPMGLWGLEERQIHGKDASGRLVELTYAFKKLREHENCVAYYCRKWF